MTEVRLPIDISPDADRFFNQTLPTDQRLQAEQLADDLARNGNGLFNDVTPDQIVHVPALLDDEDGLDAAVTEIIRQRSPNRPYSVIVAGNTSEPSIDEPLLLSNLTLVRGLVLACEDRGIPASHYYTTYPPDTPIGTVRADMHNAGFMHLRQRTAARQEPMPDVLSVGWDGDTRRMDTSYLDDGQRAYHASDKAAWVGSPRVRHDRLGPGFPRMNHVLAWADLEVILSHGSTPQHYMINGKGYLGSEGFARQRTFAEIAQLVDQIDYFFPDQLEEHSLVSRAWVSHRNWTHKMALGREATYGAIQTPHPRDPASHRRFRPSQDLNEHEFAERLQPRMEDVLFQAYSRYRHRLKEKDPNIDDNFSRDLALLHAQEVGRVALYRFGNFESSWMVLDDAVTQLYIADGEARQQANP
jgi:hypothetical protein